MKFTSKSTNLRIILKPGYPPEPISGRLAIPTLFVKFENGMVDVSDEDQIKLMLAHPGYGEDFFVYDAVDPKVQHIVQTRIPNEPEHSMVQLKYGHVDGELNPKKNLVTPEMKGALTEVAMDMAKQMAVEMVKIQMEPITALLKKLADKQDADEKKGNKNKPGAAKAKVEEKV